MNFIANWLCNPVVIFGLLLLGSAVLKYRKQQRSSGRMLVVAVSWIFLTSCTPLSQWLVYELENQYAPYKAANDGVRPEHILILGGGHTISPDLPSSIQLSGTALVRLAEGIRVQRQLQGSKLVCSGYSATKRTTQAEMLSLAAVELGVKAEDTIQLRMPSRTLEEIKSYRKRFGQSPLVIVTSARHMPRVMMICKQEGLAAIPAPTDYMLKRDPEVSQFEFYPSVQKMVMMESALHEYLGMLEIRVSRLWND